MGPAAPWSGRAVRRRGKAFAAGTTETTRRSPRVRLNFTVPSVVAKMVKSFPIPTFAPGWKRVPTWRTMMLPETTRSEP